MPTQLTAAQRLKFELLASGLRIDDSARAALRELHGEGPLSPHDYASTSGIILQLEDDVWVNAPVEAYNPNFVGTTPFALRFEDGFVVDGGGLASRARFWPQPFYHGTVGPAGPRNHFVVTHGDRGRLSPIRSCSMTCQFCNIPYDDPLSVYALKPVEALIDAARTAIDDARQPARHLLISGGTPKPKDIGWMQDIYAATLAAFPDTRIDIMMVPLPGLFDLPRLNRLGLGELSINLELFGPDTARDLMRNKYNQGRDFYLDFIAAAGEELGPGRARSMLMVGLEPLSDTLAGVRAIAERGGMPVLSPFRPDPATPLRGFAPPPADLLIEAYLRATDIVADLGLTLGPDCPPCTHNTLTLLGTRSEPAHYPNPLPTMLGS